MLAFAILFVAVHFLVSDEFLYPSFWSELSLGVIRFSQFRAFSVHACGCWHPPHLF